MNELVAICGTTVQSHIDWRRANNHTSDFQQPGPLADPAKTGVANNFLLDPPSKSMT
jgi:hypothetical protein